MADLIAYMNANPSLWALAGLAAVMLVLRVMVKLACLSITIVLAAAALMAAWLIWNDSPRPATQASEATRAVR